MIHRLGPAVLLLACTLACSSLPTFGDAGARAGASLSTDVSAHCYGWPEARFAPDNRARVSTWLQAGDAGVDVTLRAPDGAKVSVSDLLAEGKPVLLTTASVTCPVFQERHPELQRTIEKYKSDVTFATVYLIEAHPTGDPGPYKGKVSVHEYSDRGQAMTLDARTKNASEVKVVDGERLLIDDLSPGNENPFWCSWGTCANCAFLLGTDGKLAAVHEWYDPASMEGSIDALLASGGR